MRQMAPADALLLWLSAKVPNDQFLLYAFDGAATESGVAELVRRAEGSPELSLRVVDDRRWRYPRWEPGGVQSEQFAVHDGGDWQACLDAMSALPQLDTAQMPWRVIVFGEVTGVPGAGVGAVVVVQMSHALGDGTRSADLAAVLLGRSTADTDTDTGRLPPPLGTRPVSSVNAGGGSAYLRTLVVERERLSHPTVTVGALAAIAEALGGYLDERGEDISQLGAEVPMAAAGTGPVLGAHNNFRNVGVGLYPQLGTRARAQRIAAELADQRRRAAHPAVAASDAAFAAVPAPLLRWGAGRFDPSVRPARVSGHTVVASVNRGPADLSFSGHRGVLTAGFPALSPMMGLTHGVHGIGDTVAISVHAASAAVDVDGYCDRLAHALGRHP